VSTAVTTGRFKLVAVALKVAISFWTISVRRKKRDTPPTSWGDGGPQPRENAVSGHHSLQAAFEKCWVGVMASSGICQVPCARLQWSSWDGENDLGASDAQRD